MYPTTKQAAKVIGSDLYETSPCVRGHVPTLRFTKNGNCVQCNRERAAAQFSAKRAERIASVDLRRVHHPVFSSLPTTRAQAKKLGAKNYYTGIACSNGHLSPKSTVKGSCLMCMRDWQRTKWSQTATEIKYEVAKRYRDKNAERRKAQTAEWRKRNSEHVAAYQKMYRQMFELPSGVAPRYEAVLRATPKALSKAHREEINRIYAQAKTTPGMVVDHIVPLNGGFVMGLNVPWNMKIVQEATNAAKKNKFSNTCPRGFWEALPEPEKEVFAQAIFEHFRTVGFPYYSAPSEASIPQVLAKTRHNVAKGQFIRGKALVASSAALSIANYRFPHMFDVRCGGHKTAIEAFNDDAMLMAAVRGRMKSGDYMSGGGLRKHLTSMSGVQRATNFRPASAAAIYHRYAGPDAVVVDPCAGWGGRMVGAAIAANVRKYVGVEPSTKTYEGLQLVKADLGNWVDAQLLNTTQEEADIEEASADIVFTSPPYFDCEIYAEEPTQSAAKFPTKEVWREGFLRSLIENAMRWLKPGGTLCLNIANVKTYPDLEEDTLVLATETGFVYKETLQYMMPSAYKGSDAKHEPVYVWIKPLDPSST